MFWRKPERRLYAQIREYLQWKKNYSGTAYTTDREWLCKLARMIRAEDVTEIEYDDIRFFVEYYREAQPSDYRLMDACKSLRCFLRYFRARGYPIAVELDKVNPRGESVKYSV